MSDNPDYTPIKPDVSVLPHSTYAGVAVLIGSDNHQTVVIRKSNFDAVMFELEKHINLCAGLKQEAQTAANRLREAQTAARQLEKTVASLQKRLLPFENQQKTGRTGVLTPLICEKIKELYKAGRSLSQIAEYLQSERCEISYETVRRYVADARSTGRWGKPTARDTGGGLK